MDEAGHALGSAWALTGLLLESVIDAATFDFASPRRAPDRNARKRQGALAAAAVLILSVAMLWLLGSRSLSRLERRLDSLESQVRAGAADHWQYERERLRARHLAQWDDVRVDWLAHFAALASHLPPAEELVLDGWSGTLRFNGIVYDSKVRALEDRWQSPHQIAITVEGEAASRATIDQLRDSLVRSSEYTTIPAGPDTQGGRRYPFPFTLTLRSANNGEKSAASHARVEPAPPSAPRPGGAGQS